MAMPASARLNAALLLAGALALTLGVKLYFAGEGRPVDDARLIADLRARFVAQGYRVAIVDRRFQSDIVLARRGACLAAVRNGDNGTFLDDTNRHDMAAVGPVRYLYGGDYLDAPPRLGAQISASLQRILGRVGIVTSRDAVLAVAARPGCEPPPVLLEGLTAYLAS